MTKAEIKKRNKYAPKILIGVPTYEGKNYCLSQFLDNIKNYVSKSNNPRLLLSGHSKGGGLSYISTLKLMEEFK